MSRRRFAPGAPRRAFTLVEIIIALVIAGILGASFVKLILSQSNFTEKQMAKRNARTVSRNAMNIMLTDLRMVQDSGGLLAASTDSVTVRVPIAFGLFCGRTAGISTFSLLPVDSAMTAMGFYGGFAIRDPATNAYTYTDNATPIAFNSISNGTTTLCTDATLGPGITPVTYNGRTGRVIAVTESPSGSPTVGAPMFIYQQITYRFKDSGAFPGRIGLFRRVKNGANTLLNDEIIAPFDASAGFRYYILNADTAQSTPPASTALNTVRGIQLYLAGSSPSATRESGIQTAALVTGVFFKNRRDP